MIHYTLCPVCYSNSIKESIAAIDYTVTQNEFTVWTCDACKLGFTQDVPDQTEIGKYYASELYVSHSDTKEGLMHKLYHQIRKRTLHSKRKLIHQITGLSKGSILDIGCGTGSFLAGMRDAGWQITGIEPDQTARNNAFKLNGIDALPAELFMQLPEQQFDVISLWHVLEHVHELHGYMDKMQRMLKPGGKLFIAVPNFTSKDAAHYGSCWAAYDVPRHLYHFSPDSMRTLLAKHNFSLVCTKPMWYDAFYVSMLSESYHKVGGNFPLAIWHGFRSNLHAFFHKEACSSLIYISSVNKC